MISLSLPIRGETDLLLEKLSVTGCISKMGLKKWSYLSFYIKKEKLRKSMKD